MGWLLTELTQSGHLQPYIRNIWTPQNNRQGHRQHWVRILLSLEGVMGWSHYTHWLAIYVDIQMSCTVMFYIPCGRTVVKISHLCPGSSTLPRCSNPSLLSDLAPNLDKLLVPHCIKRSCQDQLYWNCLNGRKLEANKIVTEDQETNQIRLHGLDMRYEEHMYSRDI